MNMGWITLTLQPTVLRCVCGYVLGRHSMFTLGEEEKKSGCELLTPSAAKLIRSLRALSVALASPTPVLGPVTAPALAERPILPTNRRRRSS